MPNIDAPVITPKVYYNARHRELEIPHEIIDLMLQPTISRQEVLDIKHRIVFEMRAHKLVHCQQTGSKIPIAYPDNVNTYTLPYSFDQAKHDKSIVTLMTEEEFEILCDWHSTTFRQDFSDHVTANLDLWRSETKKAQIALHQTKFPPALSITAKYHQTVTEDHPLPEAPWNHYLLKDEPRYFTESDLNAGMQILARTATSTTDAAELVKPALEITVHGPKAVKMTQPGLFSSPSSVLKPNPDGPVYECSLLHLRDSAHEFEMIEEKEKETGNG